VNRRKFITLLGGGAAAWPLAARAEQSAKVPKIGLLSLSSGPTIPEEGLEQGLRDLGYVDRQTIILEYRYARGQQHRLPDLAAELLGLKIDIIVTGTTQAIQAVRRIDQAIPIVMTSVSDPIGSRLVASLARPGGNTTGLTLLSTDLAGKRLEMLREAIPGLTRIAVIAYRNHPPTALLFKETDIAAKALQVRLQVLEIELNELESAFAAMKRENAGAVIVQQAAALNPYIRRIANLAIKHQLATIHETREFVHVGGLMSYGANRYDLGRRAAVYVDKILKGASPADLPIEQPTKFDLAINLKTARALGLAVPPTLLARADEVIE
jgi:putative ABC transport system substrate-binding protein